MPECGDRDQLDPSWTPIGHGIQSVSNRCPTWPGYGDRDQLDIDWTSVGHRLDIGWTRDPIMNHHTPATFWTSVGRAGGLDFIILKTSPPRLATSFAPGPWRTPAIRILVRLFSEPGFACQSLLARVSQKTFRFAMRLRWGFVMVSTAFRCRGLGRKSRLCQSLLARVSEKTFRFAVRLR